MFFARISSFEMKKLVLSGTNPTSLQRSPFFEAFLSFFVLYLFWKKKKPQQQRTSSRSFHLDLVFDFIFFIHSSPSLIDRWFVCLLVVSFVWLFDCLIVFLHIFSKTLFSLIFSFLFFLLVCRSRRLKKILIPLYTCVRWIELISLFEHWTFGLFSFGFGGCEFRNISFKGWSFSWFFFFFINFDSFITKKKDPFLFIRQAATNNNNEHLSQTDLPWRSLKEPSCAFSIPKSPSRSKDRPTSIVNR